MPIDTSKISFTAGLKKSDQTKNPITTHTNLSPKFYDLTTGQPLAVETIIARVQVNFKRIQKLSVDSMIDLYFLHQNWNGFYNRSDSFSKFIKDNLPISHGYAYDIIKAVGVLIEHHAGTIEPDALGSLIRDTGIQKLKLIAQVRDPNKRDELLDTLLSGADLSPEEILNTNKSDHKQKPEILSQNWATGELERLGIPIQYNDESGKKLMKGDLSIDEEKKSIFLNEKLIIEFHNLNQAQMSFIYNRLIGIK